ncbi:MAG: Hsp20/alpha crystallin family protein [Thermomicrobiales bacterium]
MSMTRWDPFRDMLSLREAMQQLLEESFVRPGGGMGNRGGARTLPLDIREENDSFVVSASLPGVKPEDIQISVLGDSLTIRADTATTQERERGGYLVRERQMGSMQRTVTLPGPVDPDSVQATYEHGELTLTMPKSRAGMPRRISVQAGDQAGRLPSLEEQTPGMDKIQEKQTRQDAEDFFKQGPNAEPPSLEEQTPGLDKEQEQRTKEDAEKFFQLQGQDQSQSASNPS